MTLGVLTYMPDDNHSLRGALYEGSIFLFPANDASIALIHDIKGQIAAAFGAQAEPEKIHEIFSGPDVFAGAQKIKEAMRDKNLSRRHISALIESFGFAAAHTAADVLRTRCVPHDGWKNKAAAPAYAVHRDTWYANPQAQINWWIPVFDVAETQTFRFFPRHFRRAVANDSARFDYGEFVKAAGFQSQSAGNAVYPGCLEDIPETGQLFSAKAGDVLVFSAAHLHGTNANTSGLTRHSVDFRTLDLRDLQAGRGAPNVDNRSRGHAEADYMKLRP